MTVLSESNSKINKAVNRLIILSGSNPNLIDEIKKKQGDFLALSLPTMALLEKNNIHFKVMEDYFKNSDSYSDTELLSSSFNKWATACDRICQRHLGVQRAFSSNGFWLLHRLSDLRYIHQVIESIVQTYDHVEMYSSFKIDKLPTPVVDFSSLNFPFFGSGLEHLLCFIKEGIPSIMVFETFEEPIVNNLILREPKSHFFMRLPEIVWRRSNELIEKIVIRLRQKDGTFWVVQDGYDVTLLHKYCSQHQFKIVQKREIFEANRSRKEKIDHLNNEITKISLSFFHDWYPRYEKWLWRIVDLYLKNIVSKLPSVSVGIKMRMMEENPKALLYAIGSETVLEESVAHVANDLKIPIYYFKHGGAENMFSMPSIFDKYLERNPVIKRTQFVHNHFEEKECKKLINVTPIIAGSLSRPLKKFNSQNNKKILYSAGVPAHYSLKEVSRTISDYTRFNFSKSLINHCQDRSLRLDIKVHPAEWSIGFQYFNMLKNNYATNKRHIKIIAGGAIERILSNYGLFVFDMVATRALSMALNFDIPIILFVPSDLELRQDCYVDLKQRLHMVSNTDDLKSALNSYKKGELRSGHSADFVKKYLGTKDSNTAAKIIQSNLCSNTKYI
jgi:hypothetical protein